jgi:formyltetrahydrofolate deformylase
LKPKNAGVLRIVCPDRKGIVAAIAEFLYRNDGNILHADQHEDRENGLFLTRVEWDMDGFALGREEFARHFGALAAEFQMDAKVDYLADRPRIALFVSKYDHCLADLLHRHRAGEIACEISLVVSNHPDARPLAEFYGVPFVHVPVVGGDKAAAEARQFALLDEHRIDLIVLARYMQILSPDFVGRYPERIINVHHSFLPAFIGAKPYHQAYERGVKLIGATSHYVTDELDEGPIIEQDVLRITHRDQLDDLVQKGRDLEKAVLSRAVRWHTERRILVHAKKTYIFV